PKQGPRGAAPGQTISFERSSRSGGITRSSERSVLRLMTSSNLGGGSIASSPGLAPFTSLSTNVAAEEELPGVDPVRNEAAGVDVLARGVDRRQAMARGELHDRLALRRAERSELHDHGIALAA